MPFINGVAKIRALSNGFVKFFNFLIHFSIFYFFILIMELHVTYEQNGVVLIISGIAWFITVRLNNRMINYNRCPNCHAFGQTSDRGTSFLGRYFTMTKVTRDVYKGSSSYGNSTIKYYDRHYDDEVTETLQYRDHRQFLECGYLWDLDREEEGKTKIYYN